MHTRWLTKRQLGRSFGCLWASYAVSAYGSALALGAFPLLAVVVLHAPSIEVSLLAAVGPAVGALIAVPVAPALEFRSKRLVMIVMDLTRAAATLSIPLAYAVGCLTLFQLVAVSAVVAASKIAFNAASGAYLKTLIDGADLLVANARFESTNWSSLAIGPPLGGAAIGVFGPVVTVVVDGGSYVLSAIGIAAVRHRHRRAPLTARPQLRLADLLDGWRYLFGRDDLRRLWCNNMLVNGLIMASEPVLAVLLLGQLHFPPWQYGLVFAAPCAGGFIGSRLAKTVVERYGQPRILRTVGSLRAVWLIGLAAIRSGVAGLLTGMAVEMAIVLSMSLYNPVLASYRLQHTPEDRVTRTLSAWSIGTQTSIALFTVLAGIVAETVGPRVALLFTGLLVLVSPLLLGTAGEGDTLTATEAE